MPPAADDTMEMPPQVTPSNLGTRNLFCCFFLRSNYILTIQTTKPQNMAGLSRYHQCGCQMLCSSKFQVFWVQLFQFLFSIFFPEFWFLGPTFSIFVFNIFSRIFFFGMFGHIITSHALPTRFIASFVAIRALFRLDPNKFDKNDRFWRESKNSG